MKRPAICFCVYFCIIGWAGTGEAKSKSSKASAKTTDSAPAAAPEAAPDQNAAPAGSDAPPAADDQTGQTGQPGAAPAPDDQNAQNAAGGDTVSPDVDLNAPLPTEGEPKAKPPTTLSWQDVIVVPRKAFLKGGRFELAPFTGVSLNDNLIRHYAFGADINFFLSDVMWVGLQGQYFVKAYTGTEENVGLEYNRIPTLNKYLYAGGLNFGYAPIYGKFAWFDKSILHWEVYFTGGFGVTVTEVIPRDSRDAGWKNTLLTPAFSVGSRLFLFNWLTLNFAIRDYLFLDKFEPAMRSADLQMTKDNADSHLVQNFMAYVGVGFYLPTKFTYKTPR